MSFRFLMSYLGGAAFDRFDGPVGAEVNVGDQRDVDLLHYFRKSFRIGASGHGQSDQPASGADEAVYLPHATSHVNRRNLGHRLNDHRTGRAELYRADSDNSCFSTLNHTAIVTGPAAAGNPKPKACSSSIRAASEHATSMLGTI